MEPCSLSTYRPPTPTLRSGRELGLSVSAQAWPRAPGQKLDGSRKGRERQEAPQHHPTEPRHPRKKGFTTPALNPWPHLWGGPTPWEWWSSLFRAGRPQALQAAGPGARPGPLGACARGHQAPLPRGADRLRTLPLTLALRMFITAEKLAAPSGS